MTSRYLAQCCAIICIHRHNIKYRYSLSKPYILKGPIFSITTPTGAACVCVHVYQFVPYIHNIFIDIIVILDKDML